MNIENNSVLSSLLKLQDISNKKIAVFIRHGEREVNPNPRKDYGLDIPLNENGERQAIDFGEALAKMNIRLGAVYSSPVLRCVRTGELIRSAFIKYGGGTNINTVIPSKELQTIYQIPGKSDAVGKLYLETFKGCWMKAFEEYINGKSFGLFFPRDELRNIVSKYLRERISNTGISLFVTHDSVIAHIAFAFGIKIYSSNDMIPFCDGFIIECLR